MTKVVEVNEIYKCLSLEDLPDEIWADVIGFEGHYQVSNLGRVRSLDRFKKAKFNSISFQKGVLMKLRLNEDGYVCVDFSVNRKKKHWLLGRLVGFHFVDNPCNKPEINHKFGNKLDNRATELEWATRTENVRHATNTGLNPPPIGEKNGNSKLRDFQVIEIRKLIDIGFMNKDIAPLFNIGESAISDIRTRKRWTHVA